MKYDPTGAIRKKVINNSQQQVLSEGLIFCARSFISQLGRVWFGDELIHSIKVTSFFFSFSFLILARFLRANTWFNSRFTNECFSGAVMHEMDSQTCHFVLPVSRQPKCNQVNGIQIDRNDNKLLPIPTCPLVISADVDDGNRGVSRDSVGRAWKQGPRPRIIQYPYCPYALITIPFSAWHTQNFRHLRYPSAPIITDQMFTFNKMFSFLEK